MHMCVFTAIFQAQRTKISSSSVRWHCILPTNVQPPSYLSAIFQVSSFVTLFPSSKLLMLFYIILYSSNPAGDDYSINIYACMFVSEKGNIYLYNEDSV